MERVRRMSVSGYCSLLVVLIFAVVSTTPAGAAPQQLVAFWSPAAGGGAYILVAGMIGTVNKYMPGDVSFVQEQTTGAMEGLRRLQLAYGQKKPGFADVSTLDAWNYYKGEAEYKGKAFPELRAVVFNQFVDLYLAVPTNSPIKSWADVKGKRIGMGGPGSAVANVGHLILDAYGVTKKDFKPYYYVFKETAEGISDGSLDGGLFAGSYPIAIYMELSTLKNVRIVPVEERITKKLMGEYPGVYQNVVKAKSYKGVEEDTRIIEWTGSVWTHSGVSNDIVYNFLKTLFDHKEEYYQIHKDARVLTVANATLTIRVPFHPGAEKYLKEVGALK
jgi:TRAP transporter TAXI family solute receptor